MKSIGTMFFFLAPFALFCSRSGNGLILCPTFVILGFLCKWIGGGGFTSGGRVKVSQQEFWEIHYMNYMRNMLDKNSASEGLIAYRDKEARRSATSICKYNNVCVPSKEKQEEIARSYGFVTEQMIKDRNDKKDRLQIGKYVLMGELIEKYGHTKIGKGGLERCCFPRDEINRGRNKIKTSDDSYVSEYWVQRKYGKSIQEVWKGLSEEEKSQSAKWVESYEKKLINMAHEYTEGKRRYVRIDINF